MKNFIIDHKKGFTILIGVIIAVIIGTGVVLGLTTQYQGNQYYGKVNNPVSQKISYDSDKTAQGKYYEYRIPAYTLNSKGHVIHKTLTVDSMVGEKFTNGHYIEMTVSQTKGVTKYQRVSFSQIPKEIRPLVK